MSAGACPPAAAHCSKYQLSQARGLSPQSFKVATIENIVAASRALHSDPDP
jgi:hypothetical protein